jgi:hypothetical protein
LQLGAERSAPGGDRTAGGLCVLAAVETASIGVAGWPSRSRGASCDAYFDRDPAAGIDRNDVLAEYRGLIRREGKVIRADDDTVARWLGLI